VAAGLFEDLHEQRAAEKPRVRGRARLREPVRDRLELRPMTLESLIGQDHPARLFWDYVCTLDLGPLEDAVEAREGAPGRPIASRRLLLALWLYATSEGVGSARVLVDLCESHDAYRWLAGGVRLNHHALSDFRVAHVEFLDRLLTEGVVSLREAGLIDLDRLSHDGVRVRASAGAASFRRKATIEEQLAQAEELINRLKTETDANSADSRARAQAARERAARERKARLDAALAKHARIAAAKAARGKGDKGGDDAPGPGDDARQEDDDEDAAQGDEKKAIKSGKKKAEKPPRVSTTDPEARVMKMADGGFRPAYNAQVTTATGTTIIVGIDVSDNGSDRGLLPAACEQARRRYGAMPSAILADGGFNSNEAVEKVAGQGVKVYCSPVRNKHGTDPCAPRKGDGPGVRAWRERMASPEGQAVYKQRPITECSHALMRQNGLWQFAVRGMAKVKSLMLWHALSNNILQGHRLMREIAEPAPC
jgi:transposase